MEISWWAAILMQICFTVLIVALVVARAQLKKSTNCVHALTEVNNSLMNELKLKNNEISNLESKGHHHD